MKEMAWCEFPGSVQVWDVTNMYQETKRTIGAWSP